MVIASHESCISMTVSQEEEQAVSWSTTIHPASETAPLGNANFHSIVCVVQRGKKVGGAAISSKDSKVLTLYEDLDESSAGHAAQKSTFRVLFIQV